VVVIRVATADQLLAKSELILLSIGEDAGFREVNNLPPCVSQRSPAILKYFLYCCGKIIIG